ncbi:hypothetical protein M758_4G216600 [Ceratodon purpureus]|nr:hypothetical protein M758_4G216600 [Ceratodon purpureus]
MTYSEGGKADVEGAQWPTVPSATSHDAVVTKLATHTVPVLASERSALQGPGHECGNKLGGWGRRRRYWNAARNARGSRVMAARRRSRKSRHGCACGVSPTLVLPSHAPLRRAGTPCTTCSVAPPSPLPSVATPLASSSLTSREREPQYHSRLGCLRTPASLLGREGVCDVGVRPRLHKWSGPVLPPSDVEQRA